MEIDRATIELGLQHVCRRTWRPTPLLLREVNARLARQGSVDVPGYVYIPDTRAICAGRAELNRFIDGLTHDLLSYWKRQNSGAISHVDYLSTKGPEVDRYYAKARLQAVRNELIGVKNTTFRLHTDFLRLHYSFISWGPFFNTLGGKVRVYDALRLQQEQGVGLHEAVEFVFQAKGFSDWPNLNDYQTYCMARMTCVDRYPQYLTEIGIASHRQPVLMVSNRYLTDGLLHGPTRVRRRDPTKALRRPSYLASIATERLTEQQILSL